MVFTKALERFVSCPPIEVEGKTVGDVLRKAFDANPRLRGYVLDDQQRLRKHMTVFVGNQRISDRIHLSDPVAPSVEVYVMQALSGG